METLVDELGSEEDNGHLFPLLIQGAENFDHRDDPARRAASYPNSTLDSLLSAPKDVSIRKLFQDQWEGFLRFAIPFLFDTAKGATILLALFFFGWLLHLGKLYGLNEEYIAAFERMDFWANVGAFGILIIDFLWRLARAALQGGSQ